MRLPGGYIGGAGGLLPMENHRIFAMSFASVYSLYVAKAVRKGRKKEEVDQIIRWLFGYTQEELETHLELNTDFKTFVTMCTNPNPERERITGVVCGIRVEQIEDPVMREIRYLDKLIDELAKGKSMQKILRS
jgi:hypothetical protein